MKSLKRTFCALALVGLLVPAAASAQVTNYGNIAGLTTFQDVNTGFVWLDLNNFFDQSPNQMLGIANAAGFTLANFGQVQQLWSGLPLNAGQWSSYAAVMGSAPNRNRLHDPACVGTGGNRHRASAPSAGLTPRRSRRTAATPTARGRTALTGWAPLFIPRIAAEN